MILPRTLTLGSSIHAAGYHSKPGAHNPYCRKTKRFCHDKWRDGKDDK